LFDLSHRGLARPLSPAWAYLEGYQIQCKPPNPNPQISSWLRPWLSGWQGFDRHRVNRIVAFAEVDGYSDTIVVGLRGGL